MSFRPQPQQTPITEFELYDQRLLDLRNGLTGGDFMSEGDWISTGNSPEDVIWSSGVYGGRGEADPGKIDNGLLNFGITGKSEDFSLKLGVSAKNTRVNRNLDVMIDPKLQVSGNLNAGVQISFKEVLNFGIGKAYDFRDALFVTNTPY